MKVAWILIAAGFLFFAGVWLGETNRMTLTGYQGVRTLHERFDQLERGIIHLSQATSRPLSELPPLPTSESVDPERAGDAKPGEPHQSSADTERNPHEARAAQELVHLTDRRGRTIEVRIVEVRPYNIAVQRSDGAILLIPDGILSDEDQAFVGYLRGGHEGAEEAAAQPARDRSEFEDFDWSLFDF